MTVWLCSGQGAQKPGMGVDMLDIPEVAAVFKTMSEGLGFDLAELALEATPEEINEPVAAQALTMAVSVGVGETLKAHGIKPTAIVGFSLGQISALVLAGVLSLEDATALLKVRAHAMAQACAANPGGMVALMGASLEDAQELCGKCAEGEVLVPANINAPGQIVISGTEAALERAQEAWKEAGNRSVKLATAGAFHSPLMHDAAVELQEFCETMSFNEPSVPLICNTDAKPFCAAEASERLGKQVESGVQFEQSIRNLINEGETDFVETGFGGVLTGLVRRIDKGTTRTSLDKREKLDEFIQSSES